MSEIDDAVLESNAAFYRAFRQRDVGAMDALWAREVAVACLHPGMDVISGRAEVMRSWAGILAHEGAPALVCTREQVCVLGDAAFVTCLAGKAGDLPALVATNVFVREDGVWRMACHQAAPLTVRTGHRPVEAPDPPTWN